MAASAFDDITYAASRPTTTRAPGKAALWTSRILTGIVAVLLAMDAGMKLIRAKAAVEGSVQLGFAPDQVFVIGVIALVCLVLYLVPRTAPLGAVLWTGYFGGAVVTHLRVGNPLFTHILSGVYVSTLIWVSLYLRDPRVRALVGKAR
ncbi:MAG: DoxX family protein [bacterium]